MEKEEGGTVSIATFPLRLSLQSPNIFSHLSFLKTPSSEFYLIQLVLAMVVFQIFQINVLNKKK